ncbi:MAG: CoxG family protein [Candidatus Acidiferrales bacterium]
MLIAFGGDFSVPKNPDQVFDFLTDADRFCPLLPDFQSMQKEDATHFTVNLRVGISHIRGNAKIKLALLEAEKPRRAVYQGKGDAAGGTVTLTAGFDLEKTPEGTKVIWKGQAQIVGRLASLAGGLLEPLAKKNVQKMIDGLQAALS